MHHAIRLPSVVGSVACLFVLGACSSSSSNSSGETDAQFQTQVAQNMHDSLQTDLNDLVSAAEALQAAAPDAPWSATDPAFAAMQTAWINARHAYEHVEGATAPVFPDIDISIDGRVEDFGPNGTSTTPLSASCDMFSDDCMTGLHAVERIMYTSVTPAAVVTYETGLGYVPPQGYPTTQQQADDFKNKLCAKIVTDAKTLLAGWQPTVSDISSSFNGLISLMNEQKEKVTKAGLHQEESRYSQRTMDDLRYNLQGTSAIYAVFQPWFKSKPGGVAVDANIEAGFDTLNTLYTSSTYSGVSFPAPPGDWSDVNPSAADLATPFGQLYKSVYSAVDDTQPGSIVSQMNDAATSCGLQPFNE